VACRRQLGPYSLPSPVASGGPGEGKCPPFFNPRLKQLSHQAINWCLVSLIELLKVYVAPARLCEGSQSSFANMRRAPDQVVQQALSHLLCR
jgi:hypothetical protein